MKHLAAFFAILLFACSPLAAQTDFVKPLIAGQAIASQFNWQIGATVQSAAGASGTITFDLSYIVLPDSTQYTPWQPGLPVTILDGASTETVTLASVSCSALSGQPCTATANFKYAHNAHLQVASGTAGLQEAVNLLVSKGGGTVIADPAWTGASSQILAAQGAAGVLIEDTRAGARSWYGWNGAAYIRQSNLTAAGTVAAISSAQILNGVYNVAQFCPTPGVLNQACFTGALAAIGSAAATLFVPSGAYAISSGFTVPANVTLKFAAGAVLNIAVPAVVQLNGTILAGNYQIFSPVLPTTASGSMASGSSSLTLSSGTFTSADVGSAVYVAASSATTSDVSEGDKIIGVGDGATATFTYTATHLPVNANSVQASAETSVGDCAGYDNGSGSFTNLFGSACNVTGAVNYSTGAISVTFASPPARGFHVRLGYSSNVHWPQTGVISAVNSSTNATVSFTSSNVVSDAQVIYGGSYVKFSNDHQRLNAMWWGATGNGATDDTAALQEAMTACGQSFMTLKLPRGTYAVSNTLDAGDPFQLGIYYNGSGQMGGACNLEGVPDVAGLSQTMIQARSGFPAGAYVLQRQNAAGMDWRNFEIDANHTGANGLDAEWKEVAGISPATSNSLINVSVFNANTMAFELDNWNDAVIQNDDEAQSYGPSPIAYDLDGGGGMIQLHQVRAYNGELWISAQNGVVDGGGFFDGVSFGGQAWNYFTFDGTQIFPDAATGIAINSSSAGAEGSELLNCNSCLINVPPGGVALAGKWGRGVIFTGGFIIPTSGTPNLYGAITSGLTPAFIFNGTGINAVENAPAVGQVFYNGGNGKNLFVSNQPFNFSTGSGYGDICLGTGACGSSNNYALAGNGAQLNIGAGYSNVALLAGAAIPSGQVLNGSGTFDFSGGTLKQPANFSVGSATISNPTIAGALALSGACAGHNWVNALSNSAAPACSQPAAADLSNGVTGSGAVVLANSPALATPSIGGETISSAPRMLFTAFLPALTSNLTAATWIPDKAVTITRIEAQAETAPVGCSTNAVVEITDGANPHSLAIAAAANDSGALAQNYAAGSALTLAVVTPAAGCTTTPANLNLVVQYRMQ